MALIDVTDVLCDPDFMDRISLSRKTKTVGTDGMATESSAASTFYGVVTNDTGDILDRMLNGERIKGNIVIHTPFALRDNDEVTFRGSLYTVSKVSDYSHFGRGFVAASCDLKPIAG